VPSATKWLGVVREELAVDLRRVGVHVVSRILPRGSFNRTRTALLRALGLRIDSTSLVAGALLITGAGSVSKLLTIGSGSYISGPLQVDLEARVQIGARVYMGYEVMLVTVDHEVGDSSQRCGRRVFRPICIEDGVWIGSRAVILPGVRIGQGAVVGAGAVVTRDVPAHALVAGVPAKTVRDLNDEAFDQVPSGRPPAAAQPPAA
jgi:acetyltransferase-like isoleucine patch superfamily enzyme